MLMNESLSESWFRQQNCMKDLVGNDVLVRQLFTAEVLVLGLRREGVASQDGSGGLRSEVGSRMPVARGLGGFTDEVVDWPAAFGIGQESFVV